MSGRKNTLVIFLVLLLGFTCALPSTAAQSQNENLPTFFSAADVGFGSVDEDGELVRTLTFSDFQPMGGRLVPATMLVIPSDKPEEFTRVEYSDLEFDIEISEDFFSLRNLRSRR